MSVTPTSTAAITLSSLPTPSLSPENMLQCSQTFSFSLSLCVSVHFKI